MSKALRMLIALGLLSAGAAWGCDYDNPWIESVNPGHFQGFEWAERNDKEEDLSKGILESIDMDSYLVEKKAAQDLRLPDEDAVIEPILVAGGGQKPEPQLDRLSNIIKSFNEQFGTLFKDRDRIAKRLRDDTAPKVAADPAYQNAKKNTPQTARPAQRQRAGEGDAGTAQGRHRAPQTVRSERLLQEVRD